MDNLNNTDLLKNEQIINTSIFFRSTNRTLTWRLDHDHYFYNTANTRRLIHRAFNDWANYTLLTFREAADHEKVDFNLAFVFGEHGDGFPLNDGRGGTLAHAFPPWFSRPGEVHFDMTEKWSNK